MDLDDYLRDEARVYWALAEKTADPAEKEEFLDLALVCSEVADNVEDRLTGG